MNIGILGTGIVGRTLAIRLVELEHSVVLGTRDVAASLVNTDVDRMGNAPLREWLDENPAIRLGSFRDSAAHGVLLINATNGSGSIAAIRAAGTANLRGKVLIDVSNPLDFSRGMPPTLFVSNSDSLGEQIQSAFPETRVVKTLNTVNTNVMIRPRQLNEADHSVFLSGNDAGAKVVVGDLLRSFGWTDIIDLGDITSARGVEMYLPLWLRLWGTLGSGMINIKVVR